MQEAIRLQFEQGQENIAIKRNEKIDEKELASRTMERIKKADDLLELFDNMNKSNKQLLGYL